MAGSRAKSPNFWLGTLGPAGCIVLSLGIEHAFFPESARPWPVVVGCLVAAVLGFLAWRRGRMDRFVDVCGVEDIADKKGLGLDVDGLGIAVFRDGDDYHALLGRCSHDNAPMGRGWVDGDEAVCPIHQWRFKLASGRCTTMPGRNLHRFRCKVIAGRVWVEV